MKVYHLYKVHEGSLALHVCPRTSAVLIICDTEPTSRNNYGARHNYIWKFNITKVFRLPGTSMRPATLFIPTSLKLSVGQYWNRQMADLNSEFNTKTTSHLIYIWTFCLASRSKQQVLLFMVYLHTREVASRGKEWNFWSSPETRQELVLRQCWSLSGLWGGKIIGYLSAATIR